MTEIHQEKDGSTAPRDSIAERVARLFRPLNFPLHTAASPGGFFVGGWCGAGAPPAGIFRLAGGLRFRAGALLCHKGGMRSRSGVLRDRSAVLLRRGGGLRFQKGGRLCGPGSLLRDGGALRRPVGGGKSGLFCPLAGPFCGPAAGFLWNRLFFALPAPGFFLNPN